MNIPRSAGVLCNITSLPSDYGIGCFSDEAIKFAEMLAKTGFQWWQILPLTSIGDGNSPYSSISAFAGNALYINPKKLFERDLLSYEQLMSCKHNGNQYVADYEFAKENTAKFLKWAFENLTRAEKEKIEKFKNQNSYWIKDYAMFMALSKEYECEWTNWPDVAKSRNADFLKKAKIEFKQNYEYFIFEQYEFFEQWKDLKSKVNDMGIQIIGDLPYYVCYNSVDVWANQHLFQLDECGNPCGVAGVPPDGFSENGQVWNNPLFDIDQMKKQNYAWWRKRVDHSLKIYDALRLDHFRAFYNYFSIPYGDETAKNGEWKMSFGKELVDILKKDNQKKLLIAEDLGLLTNDVENFIEKTKIPTMKVFQFAFDGENSKYLPHNFNKNIVAYTGTHDNETTLGWLYSIDEQKRQRLFDYIDYAGNWTDGGKTCTSVKAIIRVLCMSSANLVIFPLQDLLGYGNDTRMNIPGTPNGNWKFRISNNSYDDFDFEYFEKLLKLSCRKK